VVSLLFEQYLNHLTRLVPVWAKNENTSPTIDKINRASPITQLTIIVWRVKRHKFLHEETLAQVNFTKVGAFESDIDHSYPIFLMLWNEKKEKIKRNEGDGILLKG